MTDRERSPNPSRPHEPSLLVLGTTLRQYRQQRCLSQETLAARTGMRDGKYMSQIELGRHNISVLLLLRLAAALDIPAADLLTRIDPRAPLTPDAPRTSRETRETAVTQDETPTAAQDDRATLRLLGATIRQYRHQLELSQPALATRTGLSFGYISEIELGQRNLSVLSLVRIADALEIAVMHLLAPLEEQQSPASPRTP